MHLVPPRRTHRPRHGRPPSVLRAAACALALASLVSVPAVARAGKRLQMRYTAGETWQATCETVVDASATIEGKEHSTHERQILDASLTTRETLADGGAEVSLRFERCRVDSAGRGGEAYHFDSAKSGEKDQRSQELAAAFARSLPAEVLLTFDARGQIVLTSAQETLARLVQAEPRLARRLTTMLSDEAIRQMLCGSAALPEADVAVGDTWTTTTEWTAPLLGRHRVTFEFTYLGEADFQGRPCEKIGVTMQAELHSPQNLPLRLEVVKRHSGGTLWFDETAGKITDAEWTQDVTLDVTAENKRWEQRILTTQRVTLRPAGQ